MVVTIKTKIISLNQHNKAMAIFLTKQQQNHATTKFKGFKPKYHKHVGNKTKITIQLNDKIKQLQFYNMLLRNKLNKLQEN